VSGSRKKGFVHEMVRPTVSINAALTVTLFSIHMHQI
jgi:hypothetical protein